MKSLKQVPKFNSGVRKGLKALAFYERFEHLVALALTFIISVIVMVALFRLTWDVFELLLLKSLDPLDHQVFQSIFGGIMTLLIAMEFKHSILAASRRHHNIIQVKTVLLISLLALSRKFIILDLATVSAGKIASLAAALLALGCVYWMVRLAQDREAPGDQA
jgi:uncharacterized membrane protein (DUF373 family)